MLYFLSERIIYLHVMRDTDLRIDCPEKFIHESLMKLEYS